MSGAARVLIDHALGVEWGRLPERTRRATLTFLLDTLAVGVAGRHAEPAAKVRVAVSGWTGSSPDGSAVLGCADLRLPAPYAAFVNAFQIHSQEFDCVHEPAVAHPMATVVAVLLADSERSAPAAGTELLAALVAGVDVVATLGMAVTSPLKFFRPSTAGIFGSVAALCRLRRLDRAVALDAFGYALAYASGTMQAHVEGTPALALQVAGAARSAIEAVDLAVAGLTGPHASIDGPYGYLALFEDRFDLGAPLDRLGRVFCVDELSCKPFPTGRAAHGALVALQTLMGDEGLSVENLERFVYRAPSLIARLVGRGATDGMSVAYARLCLPYLGAVCLQRGTVGLDDFDPARRADPDLLALTRRFTVEIDDESGPSAFVPAVARAVFTDGRIVDVPVTRQFGSPEWPLSRADHLAKAARCVAFGGLPDIATGLADAVDALASSDDAAATLSIAFGPSARG